MVSPARAPQALTLAYQAACDIVGANPKRASPQAVPPPITAPAVPVSRRALGLSCWPSSARLDIRVAAAMLEAATESAVPSTGPAGRMAAGGNSRAMAGGGATAAGGRAGGGRAARRAGAWSFCLV